MNCPAISTQNDLRGFCMKYPTAPKKHFYTLIAFVLVMGPFVPWVQTFQDAPESLIEKLGAPDFSVREAATLSLGKLGEKAISHLEKAKFHPDPEVRHRANEILESFRFGILPDTPPALRTAMMELRRQSTEDGRRTEIKKLAKAGDLGLKSLERLVRLSRNNEESKQLLESMAKELPTLLGTLWIRESKGEVRRFLEAFAVTHEEILPEEVYKYLLVWDSLSKEAPLFAPTSEKPLVAAFGLRAQGNFAEAGKKAELIKNRDALKMGFLVESGLWSNALSVLKNSPLEEGDSEFLAMACMFEHLQGNAKEWEKWYEKYANHKDSTATNGPEKLPGNLKILFLCDRPEKAIQKLKEFPPGQSYFQVLTARMELEEAFQLAKGKEGEKPPLDLLIQAGKIQALLGQKKQAIETLSSLREKISPTESMPLIESFLDAALSQGLTDFALESALVWLEPLKVEDLRAKIVAKATANEFEKMGELCRLTALLIADTKGKENQKAWLALLLGKAKPEEATAKIAQLREAFTRIPQPGQPPPIRMAKVIQQLARLAGHYKQNTTQLELLAPPHLDPELALDYSTGLLESAQVDKALAFLPPFLEANPGSPRGWLLLARAHFLAGKAVESKRCVEAAMLVGAGDSRSLLEHMAEMEVGENPSQSLHWTSVLLQATLPGSFESGRIFRHLAKLHSQRNQFDQAAAAQLQSLLRAADPAVYFVSVGAYLASPVAYHRHRLNAALAKNNVEMAKREVALISQYLPYDVDLPIAIHEKATSAAIKALEEPLYLKSRDRHRALIKSYPESAWLRNSAGWLMACCQKDLDEAVVHATKATQLEAEKAGYWDTLAEAQFQAGKSAEATVSIKRAVELNPQKPYYKRQVKRIQAGDRNAPRSDEEEGD